MAQVTAKVEGLMVNPLSPRKGFLDHKEELQEPDAEPSRQLSSHSTLSEDLQLELHEVKRQLSQAQDAAFEAISRAKTAEEKMAKEVHEQEERKASARRLLEESQRKRRFQEAKSKAEALEVTARKGPAPSTLAVPRPGSRPSGKVSAQSPKGLRTVFKVKREVSRQRQDEVQAVKLAAEQRKKDLDAILKQEEHERESFGTLKARLSSAEACKQLLQVQLANMAAKAERLAFEREDLLCRLAISNEAQAAAPVPAKPGRRVSERTLRRLRRTTGFTFVVIVCMALMAYIKAFHLIEIGPQGHVDLRPKVSQGMREGGRSTCWLRR